MQKYHSMADNLFDILYMKSRYGYRPTYLTKKLGDLEAPLLLCPQCKGILRDAVTMMGSVFCLNCTYQPNFPITSVRQIVNKLEIQCPLVDKCNWVGVLDQAESHVQKCVNFRVSCDLNCGNIIKRKDINDHVRNKCIYRVVSCQYCNENMRFHLLQLHHASCPSYPLKCHNMCGREISRSLMKNHISTLCPLTIISCPLNCGNVFVRKEMPDHTGNNCELRYVPCKFCHKDIRFKFLVPHVLVRCLQYPIECPNYCKLEMPRCQLENHLKSDCPLADIICPFAELGCDVLTLKKKDLKIHQKEFYLEHQELLLADRKIQNRRFMICLSAIVIIFAIFSYIYIS